MRRLNICLFYKQFNRLKKAFLLYSPPSFIHFIQKFDFPIYLCKVYHAFPAHFIRLSVFLIILLFCHGAHPVSFLLYASQHNHFYYATNCFKLISFFNSASKSAASLPSDISPEYHYPDSPDTYLQL